MNGFYTFPQQQCLGQLLSFFLCFAFMIPLSAQNPCDTIFAEEQLIIGVQDCSANVPICLPVFQEAFLTYGVFDNGLRYNNAINGCDVDTTIAYSYAGLLGTGSLGPYLLESWRVNSTIYSGNFSDIPALIDSLNHWDPMGAWQVDSTLTFTIKGGFNDHFYGAMQVSKPGVNNSTSIFGINYGIQPKGSEIYLSIDLHELAVQDTALGCWDTLSIHLACLPTEHYFDTIYAEASNSFCLDVSELPGNLMSITDQALSGNDFADLSINGLDPCINFVGNSAGSSSHLLLACDDLGFCDSTYVLIEVKNPEDQNYELTLVPGASEDLCIDTSDFIGSIVQVDSLCSNGDLVRFNYDQTSHCLRLEAIDYGVEMACYEICDQLGACILLEVEVTVRDAIERPIAQSDIDTLSGALPYLIDLTANDIYNPATDSLDFTSLPQNGSIEYLGNGQVAYSPANGTCELDFFSYRLCNASGCSVAAVTLDRLCDEIVVFSGFSPNGDARNDFLTIQGITSFPQSELYIFDRWGVQIYYRLGYQNDWAAEWDGREVPGGTYFYLLDLHDESNQQFSGYLQIHR